MQLTLLLTLLPILGAVASPAPAAGKPDDFVPHYPCSRTVPPGVCSGQDWCVTKKNGFWFENGCEAFKGVGGVGCCTLPDDD